MDFSSPLLSEPLRQKSRRTGRILFLLIVGLFLFSVFYIIIAN